MGGGGVGFENDNDDDGVGLGLLGGINGLGGLREIREDIVWSLVRKKEKRKDGVMRSRATRQHAGHKLERKWG